MILINRLTPVSFVLILFHVSAASMYETFHAKGNQFSQLVLDPETQDVYVGGRNKIYHLDSTLKLKQEITVGPVQDNQIIRNNDIVVLEIEPVSRYLFGCGTVKQGACVKYDLADIQNSTRFLATKAENFVGSSNSSLAFFDFDPLSKKSVLYVAMAYDGRKHEAFPKTMSERVISQTKNGLYNLSYRKSYLGIPIKDLSKNYPVKYIYGFKHKHFVYYLSLRGNSTYIGRVCENSGFYYYVESKMACWYDNLLNYATAAKLTSETSLLVTYWDEVTNKSFLCNHPMRDIEIVMRDTIKDCYTHNAKTLKAPSWIEENKECIETYSVGITLETCGSDESNGYILGDAQVSITKFFYNGKITAIQSYVHDGTNLYILGTSTGHLLEVIESGDQNYKVILDKDISEGSGQPIQQDMEIDSKKSHIYAISGSTVIRFPLKSCSVYTSCSTCVINNHPLKCGWCDGKCTTHKECIKGWSPDCCVPQITSISPTKGPVEGGTRLTIKGEYFSNDNPKLEIAVKVGSAPCTVVEFNRTNIFCLTIEDLSIKEGNIHVKIHSKGIPDIQPMIDGEGTSKEIFHFMVPEIYNFTPTIGPKSGGTKCNIIGKNLDIGSTVNLYIEDQKVSIEKRTPDQIFALTQKVSHVFEGQLKLEIDGKTLTTQNSYRYTPDPKVTEVQRRRFTIKSGGIDIVFIGEYLNTVQKPMLSGILVTPDIPLTPQKCVANEEGTKLFCKTPPVNDSSSGRVPVDLRLEMDGVEDLYNLGKTYPVLSRINYGNDPVLYKFDSDGHIFPHTATTKNVEIKGKSITDLVQLKDINITIGGISCSITSLKNEAIFCEPETIPEKDTDHQKFLVLVKIGYRTYNIGWVIFVSGATQGNILITALIVVLIGIIIVIGVLLYFMWKKKLLFFKQKSILPAARYSANDQVHFGENGRLIMNSNEYTERQNFLPVQTVAATSCPVIDESILLVLGDKKLLIPKEALHITEKIGQGHFGCVYRALYCKHGEKGEMLVAVKTLHKDHPRDLDIQGFLDEALIMKDFDHENILSLIGICLGKDHMPLVVLPYMAHGDLLSYLRNVNNQPTVKDLIIFGISIASGMDYLASLKFVHRDLAARNCMLNDKLVVKVADFGLSRDIYERDYYSSDNKKSKLPVKWMALESLENGTYNTKTDVWSYGVVLWELFTRGVNPYPTVDNWDMPRYLKLGRRMDKPDYCPNRIYDIMLCCWEFDQNLRPDFATIVKELTELSEMEKHRDLPCYQKTPYENVEC